MQTFICLAAIGIIGKKMSQSIKEMLAHWEKSRAKPASTPLPQRFYDVRKKRTGIPRKSTGGMTPEGEALRAKELGLDKKTADPKLI
jgi:hypothetical protein|tara:strand:- start:171 stop:431 length:261 start_codon:yes stop_codon:yes gene_type:complete